MDDAAEELDETAEIEAAPKKNKKIIIIVAVILLGVIGAAVAFSGLLGGDKAEKMPAVTGQESGEQAANTAAANKPAYYELPEFLVNLNNGSERVSFLKMSVTLELRNATVAKNIDAIKPRIMDAFNTYLRELRPSDLSGSAGIYRLREALLTRLNAMLEPDAVKDILFSEIQVQ